MYSSDRNIKVAEQEILKKQVLKSELTQDDGPLKLSSIQNGQISAEQCLENCEKSSDHQYSSNGPIEIDTASSPLIANETPEETVDAEGNGTLSGKVKTVMLGFSLLSKCQCGFVNYLKQDLAVVPLAVSGLIFFAGS